MKKLLLSLLVTLPSISFCQFKILVDPTYESKIKTAIYLIYSINATDYVRLTTECSQIRITSDSIPNQSDDQIIKIPLRLVSAPSYNNLASWLVYQSYYLSLRDRSKYLKPELKDSASTRYELEFIKLLKPETKKNIRQLKKEAKLYWETNPYDNYNPQERDSTSVSDTLTIKLVQPKKNSCIFSRLFRK